MIKTGTQFWGGSPNVGYEEYKNIADIPKEFIPTMLNSNREYRRIAKQLEKINRRKK
jgi:hypothetical protein